MIFGEHEEDFQLVNVRRTHLLQDAIRAFSKASFNCSKMLKVTFIGEASVDDGGPRRELFQLLMKDCFSKSSLFTGWPGNAVPLHNVEALALNRFYLVGKMVSTSLVQGGQPPLCLAKAVADFLIFDEIKSDPCLEDIPDIFVREKLQALAKAKSTEEMRALIEKEMDFLFECGYTKPTRSVTINDKEKIIKAIWLHYVHFVPLAELQQFRKGFRDTLQMSRLIFRDPNGVHNFLVPTRLFEVTTEFFIDAFAVEYSHQGSNKRTSEEAVILHWNEYLSDCHGKPVSLSDVLNFVSGASKLPAAGFENTPKIQFTDENCLPYSSTCAITITLPRPYAHLSFEEFKEKVDMAIRNTCGFGKP